MFRNFCNGTQLYGSGACGGLNNVSYVGNTWFNNGEISYHGMDWNLSIGSFAGVHPQNVQLIENYSYAPTYGRVMYNAVDQCDTALIKDNYIMARERFLKSGQGREWLREQLGRASPPQAD